MTKNTQELDNQRAAAWTERRKLCVVDLRPLYSAAQRREIEQLLGLEQRARQYVAFTIQPHN